MDSPTVPLRAEELNEPAGNTADEEAECRVCRSGATVEKPLYTPCLCSGSIGLVHQDCLESWLQHSRKDTCEVCSQRYEFLPEYAPDAPDILPLHLLLKTIWNKVVYQFLPLTLKIIWAIGLWIVVAPLNTNWLYRFWIRSNFIGHLNDRILPHNIKLDIIEGLILVLVIALSFIVLMSFADFLRFHWNNELNDPGQVRRNRRRRPAPRVGGLRNARNIPRRQPAINPAFINNNNNNNEENRDLLHARNINGNVDEPIALNPQPNLQPNPQPDPILRDVDNQERVVEPNVVEANVDPLNVENNNENIVVEPGVDAAAPVNADVNGGNNFNFANFVNEPEELVDNPNQNRAPEVNDQAGFNNDFINDFDAWGDDIPDREIRLPLDDVLGLREPFHLLLRNVLWLVAFNGLYIGVFASAPYMIGQAVYILLLRYNIDSYVKVHLVAFFFIKDILIEVNNLSDDSSNALRCNDILYVGLGYTTVFASIFIVHYLVQFIKMYLKHPTVLVMSDVMRSLSSITKVGILLFIRIFVLPIWLGSIVLASFNMYLNYSREVWIQFAAKQLVGAISFVWVVGISYMLTVTLSVLQIREVLHPDLLAQAIRPQEPHIDLLSSLMNESMVTHIRRICASMLVYLLLLVLFIFVPMYLCNKYSFVLQHVMDALNFCSLLRPAEASFTTWYIIPELQIPLELTVAHIVFLTVLDKHKNVIGKLQHAWVVTISKALGLTRLLLPLPMRPLAPPGISGIVHEVERDENGVPIVDRPMIRPPNGWDARNAQVISRWAWGTEEKSAEERLVAPRIYPTYWQLRILLFFVLSWLVIAAGVVGIFFAPVNIGRVVFRVLQLPIWLRHDPLLFIFGIITCISATSTLTSFNWDSINVCIDKLLSIPKSTASLLSYCVGASILSELCVGWVVQVFMVNSASDVLNWKHHLCAYFKGSLVLAIIFSCVLSNAVDRMVARSGMVAVQQYLTEVRVETLRPFVYNTTNTSFWEREERRMAAVKRLVLKPMMSVVVYHGLTMMGTVFALIMASRLLVYCNPSSIAADLVATKMSNEISLKTLQLAVVVLILISATSTLYPMIDASVCSLYRKLRDDHYLIGKKLKNVTRTRTSSEQLDSSINSSATL